MKKLNVPYIIAEAGVNHNGSIELAKELVIKAKSSGADAVKFQMFSAHSLATSDARKVAYQVQQTSEIGSQLDMLSKLELGESAHREIFEFASNLGIDIFSTAFDYASLAFLEKMNVPFIKVPSGEITNVPFLRRMASVGKPTILSTGMATIGDVDLALSIFEDSGLSRDKITLLHCSSQYPTPMADVNLQAMLTLKNAFPGVEVGYSDHTSGIEVAVAATALGARVIEKHLTLDREMEGPDHQASLEPREMEELVKSVRNVAEALGSGIKKPTSEERETCLDVRRSIVAAVDINEGQLFSEDNLTTKRPGRGVSSKYWDNLIGSKARRDYCKNEPVEW